MDYTGTVFNKTEGVLGDLTIDEKDDFLEVKLTIPSGQKVEFPLAKGLDSNAIIARTSNVINQTGLVDNPVRIEITPVT